MRCAALLVILLASQAGCGIAHSAGKGAAAGTIGGLTAKLGDRERVELLAEGISRRTASGLTYELSQPAQLEAIQRIAAALIAGSVSGASRAALGVPLATFRTGERSLTDPADPPPTPMEAIAAQAARAFSQQIAAELGPSGEGRLATSLSATTEQVSASMARGAQGELSALFPECRGADASKCLDRAIERITRASSAGIAAGLRESVGVWPLVFAFGVGALLALALAWAWSVYQTRIPARPS